MDILKNNYFHIVISSVAVYLFIIVAIRLFGKKELAQLTVYDLVFILLISNAVQNAMVGPDTSLSGGMVAAGALFLVNWGLKFLMYRFPGFGRFIQGEEILLVYKGKLNKKNLKKARISEDEVMEAIREHGYKNLSEIDLVVLEVDGNISVLSDDFKRKSTRRRKAHKVISKQT